MRKCGVRSTRNRSAGSKREAARAVPAATASRTASDAVSARATPIRSPRSGARVRSPPRRAREHDAEDQRRDAEEAGADEEEAVRLEQRASDGEALDHHARKALRELAHVGVRRAEER